jgi:outer membrane cobalamin receptor
MRRIRIFFCASAIGLGLLAQETDSAAKDSNVVRMGEYVVESQSAERDLIQNPSLESASLEIATSTVDRLQLELQDSKTLTDALDFAPGVLTETRGRKVKSFSSFRGQMYPYPDYALNGIWQREFFELPYIFPAAFIERVEILRSSGALMIGPNSGLVGAINVIPRRFDERTTIIEGEYGTYDSARTSFLTGDSLERGYYTIGGSWWGTHGPDDQNATERMFSIFGTGGFQLDGHLRLEATAFYLRGERELRQPPDPVAASLAKRTEQYSPYTVYGGNLRAVFEHSEDASTELTLGYIKRIPEYEWAEKTSKNGTYEDWEYTAGLTHAHRLTEDNVLRLGAQWNQWVCPDGKRFYTGFPMDVHTFSGFVVDEQHIGALTLDAGLRYTRTYYNKYTHATFNLVGNNLKAHPVEDEWGDPVLTATLGAKYAVNDVTELYAHFAFGTVEAPPAAVTAGGEPVERENRMMTDLGVKFERPDLGMLKIGGFLTLRDNAILLINTKELVDGDMVNIYANRDVRQYGLEIEARSAKLWDRVEVFASATFMNSIQDMDGDWQDYKEIPDQIVTAGVYSEFGPIDVNFYGKYVSHYENMRFADDKQYHDLGDFTDLNLTVGYSLGSDKQTRVYVALENLLDDEYSTVVGYPDYGFQATVGFRHQF